MLHKESGVSDILLETEWATVMEGGAETGPAADTARESSSAATAAADERERVMVVGLRGEHPRV